MKKYRLISSTKPNNGNLGTYIYYIISNEKPQIGDYSYSRYGVKIVDEELKNKLDKPPLFPYSNYLDKDWQSVGGFKVIASSDPNLDLPIISDIDVKI